MAQTTIQRRLELFKQNAPSIYLSYIAKRTISINERLEHLRSIYKEATEIEKKRITQEAEELKKELKLYSPSAPKHLEDGGQRSLET